MLEKTSTLPPYLQNSPPFKSQRPEAVASVFRLSEGAQLRELTCRRCGSKLRPCKCQPSDTIVKSEAARMRTLIRR